MNYFKIKGEVVKTVKFLHQNISTTRICVFSESENNNFLDLYAYGNIAKEMYYEVKKGNVVEFEGYIKSSCYEKNSKKIYKQDLVVKSINIVLTQL